MAEQHRATAGEWASVKARADDMVTYSCILELLCRIEALEARDEDNKDAWAARLRRPGRSQAERIASLAERITSLQERIEALEVAHRGRPNHEELPDSSLVERVADAIVAKATSAGIVNDRPARAAIREVAAWLRDQNYYGVWVWAQRLEQEAKR